MLENVITCPICLGDVEDGVEWCNCQEQYCKQCIVSYVESAINSHVFGACPPICCPSLTHATKKEKEALKQEKWKIWISEEASSRYRMMADSLLQFRCGSCHTQSSIDAGHKEDDKETLDALLVTHCSAPITEDVVIDFSAQIAAYCHDNITSDTFYATILSKFFPQLSSLENDPAWDIFVHILHTIADSERRVNLHLRYLRDRPQFKTPCCKSAHCFNCKSHSHEGVSCIENESNVDNTIVHCPECSIALVKGDGCSSISCVCGAHFCWETEKNKKDYLADFIAAYPENTSKHAAAIICTAADRSVLEYQQAKAWHRAHTIEVNAEMCNWFRRKYAHCVAQCVAKCENLRCGEHEAAGLVSAFVRAEVDKCCAENRQAQSALFTSVFTTTEERTDAAARLLHPTLYGVSGRMPFWSNEELVASAKLWVSGTSVTHEISDYELRQAKQFLYLYGHRAIRCTVQHLAHNKEELNRRFKAFLKRLNCISYKQCSGLFADISASKERIALQQSDAEWIAVCGGDEVLANSRYDAMEAEISQVLHICYTTVKTDYSNLKTLGTLTWSELISAMSWARVHKASEWEDDAFAGMFDLF